MKSATLTIAILHRAVLVWASSRVHDCYDAEDNGYSYRGLKDFSSSGRPCQNWLDVGKISPVGDNGVGNHNYCRNPDQSFDEPWCYTNDGSGLSKEQCMVDKCAEDKRDYEAEADALKRYMEGRGCGDCDNFFVHSLNDASTIPMLFSKSSCDKSEASHCSLTEVVEKHCRCSVGALHGIVRLGPVTNGPVTNGPVTNGHNMSMAKSMSTRKVRNAQSRSANASIVLHAHGFLAGRSFATGPDTSSAKFHGDCNTACFSAACSACGQCIAKCQQGPHAYCKIDSKKELWFAMCGKASEEQLLSGIKQCGDPVPTGCASR